MTEESVAMAFERHVPEHPLPDEIREMERDETVCKFCGVSYLIHNELKAMEEKLKATLAEMEHFRGAVEREKALIQQLKETEKVLEKLRHDIEEKDGSLNTLKSEVEDRDALCQRLQHKNNSLSTSLEEMESTAATLRSKNTSLVEGIRSLKSDLGHQKMFLHEVRSKFNHQIHLVQTETARIRKVTKEVCEKEISDQLKKKQLISVLEKEKAEFEDQSNRLQAKLEEYVSEVARLKSKSEDDSALQMQINDLKDLVHALETEKIGLSNQQRTTQLELEQYKEQSRNKSSEVERLTRQLQSQIKSTESGLARYQKDIDDRESEILKVKKDFQTLQRKYEEAARSEAEIKRRASASTLQVCEIKEALERAQGDCEALKAEREMMITAHQSQIEQLRESFKRRAGDMEKWPQKLDEVIRKEKQKHLAEMEVIETKLKESFIMELEIEKQKHQKLLDKYNSENSNADRRVKTELSMLEARHKGELGDLHRQMAESKARAREAESTLRKEVESLKNIIRDLENKLARLDNMGEVVSGEMNQKLLEKEREIEAARAETKAVEEAVNQLKEENVFLQDTVRRECEERFELTEALSTAKEELLKLKRPPGGYSSTSTPRTSPLHTSQANPRSTSKNHRSEEILLYKQRVKSAKSRPQPPPPPGRLDPVDTSNVNLGFDDGSITGSSPGGKVRGGVLGESRRRIAEAIGRT